MVEIGAPLRFAGKSIKELDIRARYGVQIYLIRKGQEHILPEPDYVICDGDKLLLVGEGEKISQIKRL